MGNAVGAVSYVVMGLMTIGFLADSITIVAFIKSIQNKDYNDIHIRFFPIIILFIIALFCVVLIRGIQQNETVFLNYILYAAGVMYFMLSAIAILAVCFFTFSHHYDNKDYVIQVGAALTPFFLGLVLHFFVSKQPLSYAMFTPVYIAISIVQGMFLAKNYVLNKVPETFFLHNSGKMKLFKGKTIDNELSYSHVIFEIGLCVLIFSLGIFLILFNYRSDLLA